VFAEEERRRRRVRKGLNWAERRERERPRNDYRGRRRKKEKRLSQFMIYGERVYLTWERVIFWKAGFRGWRSLATRHVPRLADEFGSLDVRHKLYKALHNNPCRLVTPTGMM
jgi:hypothetical protein